AGLWLGIVLGAVGVLLWVVALTGYTAGPRQTITALALLCRGREAPSPSAEMRNTRS
ncbi:MAG: hypothetical protein GX868_15280, partial [Actinobacteria bacterium]|nr:hypothetical protein [Actinomycetota bacterium]